MKNNIKFVLIALFFLFNLNSVAQEIFNNTEYGFTITIPKGWHTIKDKNLDYNLKEHHGWHLISFSKYDVTKHSGINPIVSVNLGNDYMSFENWEKVFLNEKNWRNKYFKNVSPIEKARVVTIDNKKAFYTFESYTFIVKKNQLPLRRKSYLVPNKNYMYYIDFIDGQQSEDEQKLFDEIAGSIKITQIK